MSGRRYEEVQHASPWNYAGTAGLFSLIAILAAAEDGLEEFLIVLAAGVLVTVFVVYVGRLRTTVEEPALRLRIGWRIPCFWKTFNLDEINSVDIVTLPFARRVGLVWGLQLGRFDGESATFATMRGNRGVRFRYDGKQYILGSQQPERLARVLAEGALKKDG